MFSTGNFVRSTSIRFSIPKSSTVLSTRYSQPKIDRSFTQVYSALAVTDGQTSSVVETKERKRQHSDLPRESRGKVNKDDRFVLLCKTPEEISELLLPYEAPKYRSKQIVSGLLNGVRSVDEIHQLPGELRQQLMEDGVVTGRSHVHSVFKSSDDTQKFLLQLFDGRIVETVGLPFFRKKENPRLTACISSQVGCSLKCTFCATGKGGFSRNLAAHEIVDQVLTVQEKMKRRVTHVVFMGMGEPLLNLKAVIEAQAWINEHIGLGARNFTISTVGVPNGIRKLANANLQLTLAVSLHAPTQKLREQLVPSAKVYPLDELLKDCRAYFAATKRRVTFEYTLIAGVNDSEEHSKQLGQLLTKNRLKTHINLLLWNKVAGIDYKRPEWSTAVHFKKVLETFEIETTLRKSRGLGASAACGQLQNLHQKEPLSEFVALT